jgi:threonylcarbamoyladenosine tRNA methylthiotransferase MtaB
VVAQVRTLVANGYAEIVLTGVDITAYGTDLPGDLTLGKLVTKVLKLVPELKRLRLSSIDSVEADEALLRTIAEEERLMPHLHLSLQAGDDLTLKRMKRRHSRAHAVRFCEQVRKLRPDIVFGADLIAGFPTESDAMFARSLSLIDDCGLTFLHVFPFSARPGTPAARMPLLNGAVIAKRAVELREKGFEALRRHLVNAKGRHIQVLMESAGRGRAGDFTPVKIEASATGTKVIEAVVSGHDGSALIARMRA